jgi:hypothetical protein
MHAATVITVIKAELNANSTVKVELRQKMAPTVPERSNYTYASSASARVNHSYTEQADGSLGGRKLQQGWSSNFDVFFFTSKVLAFIR